MADVFISYSCKDIQFAQRLHQELEARGREPCQSALVAVTSHYVVIQSRDKSRENST